MRIAFLGLASSLALFAAGARGQEGGGSFVLDTITVEGGFEEARGPFEGWLAGLTATATKTGTPLLEVPQSVSIIGQAEMEARGVTRLNEAFRYAPGVSAELDGMDSRFDAVTLRGFSTEGVTWLDGLRFQGGGGAGNNWTIPQIDPFTLERVEVLKGPSSTLFGQMSPGGMINQISKRPQPAAARRGEFTLDGYGEPTVAVDLTGPLTGAADYRLIVKGGVTGSEVKDGDRDELLLAPSVALTMLEDGRLTLYGQWSRDTGGIDYAWLPAYGTLYDNPNGEIDRDLLVGDPNFNRYDRDQAIGGLEFEKPLTPSLTLRSALRFSRIHSEIDTLQSDMFAFDDPVAVPGSWDWRTIERYAVQAEGTARAVAADASLYYNVAIGAAEHRVVAGMDYFRTDFDASRYSGEVLGGRAGIDVFDPSYGASVGEFGLLSDLDSRLTQVGLYAQDQVAFGRWRFVAGLRGDWSQSEATAVYGYGGVEESDQTDRALSGRLGAVYLFDNGVAPYVSWGTSFEPVIGATAEGDAFEPMRGEQVEVGVRYAPSNDILLSASAFDIRQTNRLTDDPVNGWPDQVQTGEVRVRGAEAELRADFANGWSTTIAYTYLDHEVTASEIPEELGQPLLAAPNHQASAWANYHLPSGTLAGWQFGLGVRYTGPTRGGDIETASGYAGMSIPGYTLVDARVFMPLAALAPELGEGAGLNLSVSNLFDKTYVAGCGSIWTCGYGYGRTVELTLRAMF